MAETEPFTGTIIPYSKHVIGCMGMYNEERLNNYIYKSKDFIPRLKMIETQPKGVDDAVVA